MRFLFFFLIFVVLIGVVSVNIWSEAVHTPLDDKNKETVAFVIKEGETGKQVSSRLKEEGLIKSAQIADLYYRSLSIRSFAPQIQVGEYSLSPSLSIVDIFEIITKTGTTEQKITFIEGWTNAQMAKKIAESIPESGYDLNMAEFWEKSTSLEGFLFPDTYFVDNGTTAKDIINRMQVNFDQKVTKTMRDDALEEGLSLEEVIILASIVEREALSVEDRPIIAGILLKRYRNEWLLDADATVQYAMFLRDCEIFAQGDQLVGLETCDFWPQTISENDLQLDSPYNTRKNVGLPPAPITNPGLASIRAVIYPQETQYWFYLTDKNGITYYAETLEGHNGNILRYLK